MFSHYYMLDSHVSVKDSASCVWAVVGSCWRRIGIGSADWRVRGVGVTLDWGDIATNVTSSHWRNIIVVSNVGSDWASIHWFISGV